LIVRSLVRLGVLSAVILWSAGARADLLNRTDGATVFMPVGILGSISNRGSGLGVELTLDMQLRKPGWGWGLLAQYEHFSDGANRLTGGGQLLLYFMGFELGIARHDEFGAADTALHLAPFVSAYGCLSAALRLDVPVFHSGPPPPTLEVGLTVTIKFPIPINGRMP
jgi:hypothetical protein